MNYPLPISNSIDSSMFIRMVDDKSASYKLYWMYGIFNEVILGNQEITFHRLVSRMLSLAWYSVTEYHLNLGFSDKIEETILLINKRNQIKNTELPKVITDRIEKIEDPQILNRMKTFYNNVPYRLLHAFYKTRIKSELQGEKISDHRLHKRMALCQVLGCEVLCTRTNTDIRAIFMFFNKCYIFGHDK